ncbi:GNAT family N-acetyltransferase [Vibrio rhodolitus]|uniref:GNAT family N-acetyltransferase n=1 Tax=Vibrio rhodolitus TaxID=2231649 RepID=UPI000E0B3384|nr:GNAT family N-acetyltransferase [Vibrio rhodolitus]
MFKMRSATEADVATIYRFIHELADYERASHHVKASEQDIQRSLFAANASANAMICEQDGEAVGFAVYFFNYSTWMGRYGLYLEDLYVSPNYRGSGAGKFIMQTLAKIAVENNCARFEWAVLDWNQPAIDFYTSIGAKEQSEWRTYRLDGDALYQFAQ